MNILLTISRIKELITNQYDEKQNGMRSKLKSTSETKTLHTHYKNKNITEI